MSPGGPGIGFGHSSNLKPTKKCDRCGLRYPKDEERCSHCSELNARELDELLHRLKEEAGANSNLGTKFLLVSVVLAFFVFLLFL